MGYVCVLRDEWKRGLHVSHGLCTGADTGGGAKGAVAPPQPGQKYRLF